MADQPPAEADLDQQQDADGLPGAPEGGAGEQAPLLSVAGFEGPLDFLLEMVRRHRVDLGRLSIVTLTDQLVAALAASAGRVALERRSEWLVMASHLVLLKAQLLVPATPEVAALARTEAERRLQQLAAIAGTRAATAWLSARPQLGQEVFGRGRVVQQPRPQAELYVAFLEATLVLLEDRVGQGEQSPASVYRPTRPELWRVTDAVERLRRMLERNPAGGPLQHFLPELPTGSPDAALRRRAALASTLVAGLELARDGALDLAQDEPFGPVLISSVGGDASASATPLQ